MDLRYGFKCLHNDCRYYAIYSGDERPVYCDFHHPNPDAKVKPVFKGYKHRICIEPSCNKRASFNYENGMKQIFCQDHKQPRMINVASVKCKECKRGYAKYAYKKNYPKASLCRDCRDKKLDKTNIVDCYEILCDPPNCWTQATFGYNRKDKHEWRCKDHKKNDMFDVKNIYRLCQFVGGCDHQANYNFPNQTTGAFCKTHKDIGMIDITHPKCEYNHCILRPCYNFQYETKGRFCLNHKEKSMVDVVSKKCTQCCKVPIYNFPQYSYPIVCPDHIEIGMVDVRHLICKVEGCYTQASYGYLGHTVCHCATHKLPGMLRQSKRRCTHQGCNEYACFGYETMFPIHCEVHKQQDEINLVEQQCINCGLLYILDTGKLCMFCESKSKEIRLKKQHIIKMWLLTNEYKFIINDKIIDHGICIRSRPDFVMEAEHGGLMIVLEVDENMHRHGSDYTPDCEKTRMINISQALGQPTLFIRFNPDKYIKVGKTISNDNPKERHKVLKKWLDYYISFPIDKIFEIGFCSVIYLYYNEFDMENVKEQILLPFE